MTPAQAGRARNAVAEFIQTSVAPGDRVTLLTTRGELWWTATMPHQGADQLTTLVGRLESQRTTHSSLDAMTDYEAMQIELHNDPLVIARVMRRG